MADIDDINDAIADAATQPKRMRHANREVEQHDIDQLTKAADRVAANNANAIFGMRLYREVPPGTG